MKIAKYYKNQTLEEITEFIKKKNHDNNVILIGDLNKVITNKKIDYFLLENRLFDIYG